VNDEIDVPRLEHGYGCPHVVASAHDVPVQGSWVHQSRHFSNSSRNPACDSEPRSFSWNRFLSNLWFLNDYADSLADPPRVRYRLALLSHL
jgi:hypothetical protein